MFAPIYFPPVAPPSGAVLAVERAILAAEGHNRVAGRYIADTALAATARRHEAERRVAAAERETRWLAAHRCPWCGRPVVPGLALRDHQRRAGARPAVPGRAGRSHPRSGRPPRVRARVPGGCVMPAPTPARPRAVQIDAFARPVPTPRCPRVSELAVHAQPAARLAPRARRHSPWKSC